MRFKVVVLALFASILQAEVFHSCSIVNARAVSLDNGWALMNDEGKILTPKVYCAGDEYSDGLIRFEQCNPGNEKTFDYLTPDGKVALSIKAQDAARFSEGLAAIQDGKGLWGYIDKHGKTVIRPQFQDTHPFSEGVAAVKIDDTWEYIDKSGKTAVKPQAEGKEIFGAGEFRSGAALVVLFDSANDKYLKGFIDHSGKWLLTPTPNLTGELDNGLAPLWSDSDKKIGFVDSTGRFVISPQFTDNASLPFEQGLAAVYVGEKPDMKAGFIDKEGHWAIPPKFEEAYHFCNGLAPVKSNNLWGYVDKDGKLVIAPTYQHAESFEDGIAEVYSKDAKGILHRQLINTNGSVLYRSSQETTLTDLDARKSKNNHRKDN